MGRLRVAQLVSGIAIGAQSGGAELVGIQIARNLDRRDFEPAIFALWKYGGASEEEWLHRLEQEDIPVAGLVSPGRSFVRDLWLAFRRLWSFTDQFSPQVINSHSERGDLLNMLIRCLHPSHPCCIRTVHIERQWITHPFFGGILEQAMFPLVYKQEIAISHAVRQMLDKRVLCRAMRKRASLCYNGIEERWFTEQRRPNCGANLPAGVPAVRPRLGVIGRLTEQKNHADLLKALRWVCKDRVVHLFVAGTGPLESELRRMAAEFGIQEYIHFLGNRRDVMDLLRALDLFILPSAWEGFPTVLLEAMSQGTPVIATDVSGSRELILPQETGILVPPHDPERLGQAILYCLDHPTEIERMARRAQEHARRFTIQETARCHARAYQQAIRRSSSACNSHSG